MLIFFIATVLKMEFYQLILKKKKLKNYQSMLIEKKKYLVDLEEEKIIYGNNEIKFQVDHLKRNVTRRTR